MAYALWTVALLPVCAACGCWVLAPVLVGPEGWLGLMQLADTTVGWWLSCVKSYVSVQFICCIMICINIYNTVSDMCVWHCLTLYYSLIDVIMYIVAHSLIALHYISCIATVISNVHRILGNCNAWFIEDCSNNFSPTQAYNPSLIATSHWKPKLYNQRTLNSDPWPLASSCFMLDLVRLSVSPLNLSWPCHHVFCRWCC